MPVVLDTSLLPVRQRTEAVRAALISPVAPAAVSVPPPAQAKITHWSLGPGAELLHHVSTGHRLTRTSKHLRSDNPERISLGLPRSGVSRIRHRDLADGDRIGELQLVDLTSPYDFWVAEPSSIQAVIVDYTQLGIPVDAVRSAIPRLESSPLYGLVRRHLFELPGVLDELGSNPAAAMLGASTVELVRALVASAGNDEEPWVHDIMHGTLFTRLTAFIRQNLRAPDLGAARLARAHGVSVRTVYATFAKEGEQLSEWVMRRRLHEARRELAESPGVTVAEVARSWGFADPRHFARRFRGEYGLSPVEWQRAASATRP